MMRTNFSKMHDIWRSKQKFLIQNFHINNVATISIKWNIRNFDIDIECERIFQKFCECIDKIKFFFFFAMTTIHLSNSKTKILSIVSILLKFTIFALIFDISNCICFTTDENSSIKLISCDNFCKFVKTMIHLTYFETINFAKISLFVLFTIIHVFSISNRICFKKCKNS